jgi:PiT family inorganic phosphate transporter
MKITGDSPLPGTTHGYLFSALVILSASALGAPVATTHVVATSIMTIGASERPRAVRWAKAKDIATTWVVTIPSAALVAKMC